MYMYAFNIILSDLSSLKKVSSFYIININSIQKEQFQPQITGYIYMYVVAYSLLAFSCLAKGGHS